VYLIDFIRIFNWKNNRQNFSYSSTTSAKRSKKGAAKAQLTESALIREAIKFYLRERANDSLFHLQPKEEEVSALSK
jgi:hypothetical protein